MAEAPAGEEVVEPADDPVSSAAEPEPEPEGPEGDMAAMLEAHNQFRAAHCAAPLSWSEKLARDAQDWADHLRDSGCQLAHDNKTRQGENLAMFTPSGRVRGADVAAGWYGEEADYDYQNPGFSPRTGHFTQVVWQGTRELGCAVVQCGGGDIWVCRYDPSGNYRGQYRDNVLPKTCR